MIPAHHRKCQDGRIFDGHPEPAPPEEFRLDPEKIVAGPTELEDQGLPEGRRIHVNRWSQSVRSHPEEVQEDPGVQGSIQLHRHTQDLAAAKGHPVSQSQGLFRRKESFFPVGKLR